MSKKVIFVDAIYQYPQRFLLTDLGSGLYTIEASPGTITQEGTLLSAANLNAIADEVIFKLTDTSSSTTTYTASLDGLSAYFENLTAIFKANNTNTGASTFNINTIGAANIKKIDNSGTKVALEANDLVKNRYYTLTYDGSDFVIENPSSDVAELITAVTAIETRLDSDEASINTLKTEGVRFVISTGSANAYGVSLNDVTAYYSGLVVNMVANFTNTGAATLQVNSLDAKNIKFDDSDVASGDIPNNKISTFIYDGVNFNLQPSASKLAAHLTDTMYYSITKSGLDSNGIYTEVDHIRADSTLILKSVLSGGTSPKYTTKTETKYATDGTTVEWTKTYTITYDSNGNVASEVLSA